MILKIVQTGDPVLRRKADALTEDQIRSAEVQMLIALMRETMRDAPGVGLAAPQVGVGLRLAVIEDAPEYMRHVDAAVLAERERQPVPFHVIVNPRLTVVDDAPAEFQEGCLSVTGFSAVVPRARAVEVEALDEHARPVRISARGWYARILQHEIDHLDGRLYIDRMDPRTFSTPENHSRFWAGLSVSEIRKILDGGS
jgi:peptide deformylase